MPQDLILEYIDAAIDAGSIGSDEIYHWFDLLDASLSNDYKSQTIRYFFDCWSDAIGHEYMVYFIRDPSKWIETAKELKKWWESDIKPNKGLVWQDCGL